jgi:hypothetical protein
VQAYVTTLSEGSKVSLSQLKGKLKPNQLTSMRFTWSWFVVCGETTNQDHVKRIEVIFAGVRRKGIRESFKSCKTEVSMFQSQLISSG